MESSVAEITQCTLHKKRIEYICMDTSCIGDTQCCMACVKISHKNCKDDLIVEIEKVPGIFEFKPLESIGEINECIKNIVTENLDKLDNNLAAFNKTLALLEKKDICEADITPEFVRLLKNHYQVKLKENCPEETEFVPMFQNNANELEKARKDFESHLNDQLDDFKENLKHLSLDITTFLDPQLFLCNSNIEVKSIGNELFFKRKQDCNDYNYFSCIYKEPLVTHTKFTITIEGVNTGDPYLDIGLIDEDKFNISKNNPVIPFASSTCSYCGTSSSNLDGDYTSSNFQPGRIVYMEFQPDKGWLKYTTNDGKVKLRTHILSTSKKYYFYFTLYHKESSCIIKRA